MEHIRLAGVSTFVNLCRNMVFTVPVTAKYLGFKWYKFFPQVITTVISSFMIIGVGALIKSFLPQGSWLMFFISAVIVGIIGLIINFGIVLNKEERNYLLGRIKGKLNRNK